jgi:hypothetical protein
LRGQSFDENGFSQPLADAEARVANLANNVGLPTEQLDFLVFAQTHFAKTNAKFRRCGEFFDANNAAGFDAAQGTNVLAGALAF